MRIQIAAVLALAVVAAACGSSKPTDEPEDSTPAEPVRTFADDTIGVKDKARIRTETAVEGHREALERRLDADEGAPAAPAESDESAEPAQE